MRDPLDSGHAPVKRWEEFRAQYGAALLTHLVFRDLKITSPDAVMDLWGRLQSSLCDYPDLLQEDAEREGRQWDGEVPFHSADGDIAYWAHVDDLADLLGALFPHDLQNADLDRPMAAAAVVALNAALEAYAKTLDVPLGKGLPDGVREYLAAAGLSPSVQHFDALVDSDATRNIVVHNRGIVDTTYIRSVRNPPYHEGEFRVISDSLVDTFADAIMAVARLLRSTDN